MGDGNTWITGTQSSPVGSLETLGQDGPAGDFSVIRQKSAGDDLSAGVEGGEDQSQRKQGDHRWKFREK